MQAYRPQHFGRAVEPILQIHCGLQKIRGTTSILALKAIATFVAVESKFISTIVLLPFELILFSPSRLCDWYGRHRVYDRTLRARNPRLGTSVPTCRSSRAVGAIRVDLTQQLLTIAGSILLVPGGHTIDYGPLVPLPIRSNIVRRHPVLRSPVILEQPAGGVKIIPLSLPTFRLFTGIIGLHINHRCRRFRISG